MNTCLLRVRGADRIKKKIEIKAQKKKKKKKNLVEILEKNFNEKKKKIPGAEKSPKKIPEAKNFSKKSSEKILEPLKSLKKFLEPQILAKNPLKKF